MRERIKQLLQHYGITQSEFAARINVSKGAVSHVMSSGGRHGNFSDEKIVSILDAFPDINREWLVNGIGDMLSVNTNGHAGGVQGTFDFTAETVAKPAEVKMPKIAPTAQPFTYKPPVNNEPAVVPEPEPVAAPNKSAATHNKAIDRIVVFYTDGSFTIHKPNDGAQTIGN